MPIEQEHMDTINSCNDTLIRLALYARDISEAPERIGLPIHKEIREISKQLFQEYESMKNVVGAILSSDIKESGERTALILKAALSGIKMAKSEETAQE